MKSQVIRVFVRLVFVLAFSFARPAPASVHSWIGPSSGGVWSNAANWSGGVPTSNEGGVIGTEVDFGSGIQSTDDIPGLVINEIRFLGGNNVVSGTTTLGFGTTGFDSTNVKNDAGTNTFASSLPLDFSSGLAVYVNAGTVTIAGTMTGSGGILLNAVNVNGTLSLTAHNSYAGTTAILQGTLTLDAVATDAVPGDVSIGNGSGAAGTAVLKLLHASQIASGNVFIAPDGVFDVNGVSESIGKLVSSGGPGTTATVKLNGGALGVSGASGTAIFEGDILGPLGTFTKYGGFTQVLAGTNTFTGATSLQGGTLFINGVQSGSAINAGNTTTLLGGGTMGPVTLQPGSLFSPGASTASLFGGTALLGVSGNLTLAPGSTYSVQLAGTSVGTTYDRTAVSGAANLNDASLGVLTSYAASNGDTFSILTATGTLTGTFNGLSEGSLVSSGPYSLRISYLPHAVTLTVCQKLTAVSITAMGATCVAPGTTGGIATVSDTGGEGNTHQWVYSSMGSLVNIPGETGPTYVIDANDFPGPGTYTLACVTTTTCGTPKTSNGIFVTIGTDSMPPILSPPADVVVTQTICS